jgi:predicted phosphodiesterase
MLGISERLVLSSGPVAGFRRRLLAPGFLAVFALACGSSSSSADPGFDPSGDPAVEVLADVIEVAMDLPGDHLDTGDLGAAVDVADAMTDTLYDVTPDVAEGVIDTPQPFHWASGCEGAGTGAAWTLIPDATFLRGPLVQMSDRDRATIVWRTATPSQDEGCVHLTWSDQYRMECGLPDANGQYEIQVVGLPAASEVSYHVQVGKVLTSQLTFRTLPDRPVPMKFAVFADAHNKVENLQKMSTLALGMGVDFAIGIGDLTGVGLPEEFDQTLKGFQDLGSRVNVWAVLGNHDEKNIKGYFDAFVLPQGNEEESAAGLGEGWWARRMGNVWIGGGWIRDFYLSMPDADWGQVGWFRRQFETEEFKTAQWKLFFIHEPAYSTQWGTECSSNGEQCLRVALIPMLAAAGVQASFHGHMHGIEWGAVEGVNTFIVGGLCGCGMDSGDCPTPDGFPAPWNGIYGIANFAVVETGCDGLTVRYMDLEGKLLKQIDIPSKPDGT